MTQSLLTLTEKPIQGVSYDKTKPETRKPWLEQRQGGITATEIRDWGTASKRREIIQFKVTGEMEDLSHNVYVNHGNLREPVIANWIQARFGIQPCDAVFVSAANGRHLASPDGISVHPFTQELLFGTPDAVLSEIKTSKHNLHPGQLDESRVLVDIDPNSHFAKSNYYTQMQWQMFVMGAARTLFVWEQHDGVIDTEGTGTFNPIGIPEYVWVERDDLLIEKLIDVAARALVEIDAARASLKATEMPPISDLPSEDVVRVADLLKARDAEAAAAAAKKAAWEPLAEKYVGEDKPDMKVDLGIATFTVSTSTPAPKTVKRTVVDEDAMRRKAPALVAKYEALRERYTSEVPEVVEGKPVQKLTITAKKAN